MRSPSARSRNCVCGRYAGWVGGAIIIAVEGIGLGLDFLKFIQPSFRIDITLITVTIEWLTLTWGFQWKS
jgi:hypothetical protein